MRPRRKLDLGSLPALSGPVQGRRARRPHVRGNLDGPPYVPAVVTAAAGFVDESRGRVPFVPVFVIPGDHWLDPLGIIGHKARGADDPGDGVQDPRGVDEPDVGAHVRRNVVERPLDRMPSWQTRCLYMSRRIEFGLSPEAC
jgi:hypothetical protein